MFNDNDIDWAANYILSHLVKYNTCMRSCQYKILSNVLFLSKKLHIFEINSSPLCSFCNLYDETPLNIFYEFDRVKCIWLDLIQYFQNSLKLPTLIPHTVIFWILDFVSNESIFLQNKVFINLILLIFKACVGYFLLIFFTI